MVPSRDILNYLKAQPFEPFTLRLTSGRTYDIRHPEMIQLGRTTMTIFTLLSNEPEAGRDRQVEASLLLTESVEPLDTATRPQGV